MGTCLPIAMRQATFHNMPIGFATANKAPVDEWIPLGIDHGSAFADDEILLCLTIFTNKVLFAMDCYGVFSPARAWSGAVPPGEGSEGESSPSCCPVHLRFWRSSRVPQGPGAPGQGFPRFPVATSGCGRKVAEGSTSGSMGSGASRGSARCTAIIWEHLCQRHGDQSNSIDDANVYKLLYHIISAP